MKNWYERRLDFRYQVTLRNHFLRFLTEFCACLILKDIKHESDYAGDHPTGLDETGSGWRVLLCCKLQASLLSSVYITVLVIVKLHMHWLRDALMYRLIGVDSIIEWRSGVSASCPSGSDFKRVRRRATEETEKSNGSVASEVC